MTTTIQPDTRLTGRWLTLARSAWYVCAVLVAIVLLGALPVYYSHYAQAIRADPYGLGSFNLPLQALVGLSDLAGGFISFALAVLLFWRKPYDRMALFVSFFLLITAPASSYSLDFFLTAYFGAPSTYQLGSALQTPLYVLILCIFPDGRFVPRWTRWLFLVSIPASLLGAVNDSAFLSIVTLGLFILLTYAQIYRYRRVSSFLERNQIKWVVFGFLVSLVLALTISILFKQVRPPPNWVLPLSFAIAILHSRLWDIDVVIRRTLQYSVLTGALALTYFASVVLLQAAFRVLTGQGQNQLVTVASTLAIAALFNPVRRRVQDVIDRRFYRKKYDAAKTLAEFAATCRDETDLDKLAASLIAVVQETMQPESISLWLKDFNAKTPRRDPHAGIGDAKDGIHP
jgi:hypothetical protein